MLAPREIDEYLLPTERRVIRVRQHFAVMLKDVLVTTLFLLLMVVAQRYLPPSVLVDNLTFYLSLVAVIRYTVLTILWWIERIVITDKRVMLAQGFIVHRVGMMPLSKVTDLTFQRSCAAACSATAPCSSSRRGRSMPSTGSTTYRDRRRSTRRCPN